MSFLEKERNSLLILAICIIIAALIIVPLKHGIAPGEGHLKDEEGYYAWAVLYKNGYYSLPIDKAEGEYHYHESISIDPRISDIVFYVEVCALDGDNKSDDIIVNLKWKNGTEIPDALIRVFLFKDKVLEERTDYSGNAELHNIPLGPRPIEVIIPSEPPIIFHRTVEIQGNIARYGIYSETNISVLTDNILDNKTIRLLYKNGYPANGLALLKKEEIINYSNENGEVILTGIKEKYGIFVVAIPHINSNEIFYEPVPYVHVFLDGKPCGITDERGTFFCSVSDEVELDIIVRDTFKRPMENVEIFLDGNEIGKTDENGRLVFKTQLDMREHFLSYHKKVDGYPIPLASGLGMVDGELHYVNHWPPGPSMLLSWFMVLGIENFFGLFLYALLIASTYLLARRFFGHRWALLTAFLVMTNGIVIMLFYGQWMGDLASASFCFLGFFLFIEGAERLISGRRKFPLILLFISGLSFAAGVTMRYSSIILCISPLFYIIWRIYPWGGKMRELFSKVNIKKVITVIFPWIIGLSIIGILLAQYNTTYLGGPFNSGYQSKHTLFIVSDNHGNQSLVTYQPEENFFEKYFNYDMDDFLNMPRIFLFILCFIPLFFVSLLGILKWRKSLVVGLFAWIAGILFIYLSQGWVLNRVVGDIRYYVAIVPAASILSVFILREIWHSNYWNELRGKKIFMLTVASLLLISGIIASADLVKSQYSRFQHMPPGLKNEIELELNELIINPEKYEGEIIFVRAIVERVLSQNAFMIEGEIVVFMQDGIEVKKGDKVSIRGMFVKDEKRPGEWMIRCQPGDVGLGEMQPLPNGKIPPFKPMKILMPTTMQILAGVFGLMAIVIIYSIGLICRRKSLS